MSAAQKSRVVHVALLLLTLWPLVHLALALRWDVSPWKLAGWGMYAAPRFALVGMEVYGRADATEPWVQLTEPSPRLQATAAEFLEAHRWLRRLAPSSRLVAAVRAERPAWREIRLSIAYPVLDRDTSRVRLRYDERTDP